jgi:predicted RNase H-like HicB family nuclease
MAQFYGIMDGSGDNWGIRIPDLPGCHGGGDTPAAALADAISAAREWAEHRAGKGFALPSPTPLDRILGEEIQPHEVIVNIPVLLDSGRPVRANLSLDAALLADIDRAARQRGLTRSGFIASAAREKILAEAAN